MYKRIFTAITAAVIVFLLLILSGPMGVAALADQRCHTVAYTK